MKTFSKRALVASMTASLALFAASLTHAADGPPKNWTAPLYKIRAQKLADEIIATHPELSSVAFHAVPPGLTEVHTTIAGSHHEHIGSPDHFDEIIAAQTGWTVLDARRHDDAEGTAGKLVPMLPLRDTGGKDIGLLVLGYKNSSAGEFSYEYYLQAASTLRDSLQSKIPSLKALFEPAK
jgi:hypothetical protein